MGGVQIPRYDHGGIDLAEMCVVRARFTLAFTGVALRPEYLPYLTPNARIRMTALGVACNSLRKVP